VQNVIDQILANVRSTDGVKVIEPAAVGQTVRRNELLMFAKPEIFMVENLDSARATLEMLFAKLHEFGAEVHGVVIVGGKALEDHEIMNRHYGYINMLSRKASEVISPEERAKIEQLLGVSLNEYIVYGGHEFLYSHPGYTPKSLDDMWGTKKSERVKGGFYVQAYDVSGEKVVLVNAFHPVQLQHFTEPTHRIVLLLIHSDTDWGTLRNNLVGATNPAKADPNSIRGALYADPSAYGFSEVGMGNNGVHLSAGPYEGAFEILNFLGTLVNLYVSDTPPLIIRRLMDAGLTLDQALESTKKPAIVKDGKDTNLFDATEDVNTDEAVALYVENVRA
jgi:hypothetical protein